MPRAQRFPRGVFTLSLDFELVWGSRDLYDPLEPLLEQARVTRTEVFGPLLGRLQGLGIPATWATVGHLFLAEARREGGVLHPQVVPPRHPWYPRPWFQDVPEGSEAQHPEYYARSLVERLVQAGQEIGSHSFSHILFDDPGCSRQCADSDLAACVALARGLGVELRSFVFPRNRLGHLDLLQRHGFLCYRGPSPDWYAPLPRALGRLGHLAQVLRASPPPTVMPERDPHGLWNIPASSSFFPAEGRRRHIPVRLRTERALAGLRAARTDGCLFHLWLHPINLASLPGPMLEGLGRVLDEAARLRDRGELEILSMGQLAARMQDGAAEAATVAA